MTKVHEVLERDPRTAQLANKGQARFTEDSESATDTELRAELSSFVCAGEFETSLKRILERYLTNLDSPRQESVWVSGFFGSGKSHLLKMLAHLWVNTKFSDGSTARGLVKQLPSEIHEHLVELDIKARRLGRTEPMMAAGTLLSGNEHVRLGVLQVIFRACGLPTQVEQARFSFWLQDEGVLSQVQRAVEAKGKKWKDELNHLYVSPVLAGAVLEALPGLANSPPGVLQQLRVQFPRPKADLNTDEFIELARKALSINGELPLTALVLDEAQQYIGEDLKRSSTVTELAEAIQTQMSSRVLLVASGQSALSGTPALQWLTDRFKITVNLTDAEVEGVTRKVLLQKKASAKANLEKMLKDSAGEVSRHLQGTDFARSGDDAVEDYPLLPTRRRFWDACFRSVTGGIHGQLRSQLRILHDSLRDVAEMPLGTVIPASDLYHALAADLVNARVLSNEITTRIAELGDDPENGSDKQNLCGLVFLAGKLPRTQKRGGGVGRLRLCCRTSWSEISPKIRLLSEKRYLSY